MSVACLPMYDLPEIRAATDAWWAGLARHFRAAGIDDAPRWLDRASGREGLWLSPGLVFGQTCGYPLTHALAGRVGYVATPCYAAPGCEGADYCSFVIVAEEAPVGNFADLEGGRCAVNGLDSHSGANALRALAATCREDGAFFATMTISGSHRQSIALVARGEAEAAAVDCVTHALLARHAPAALAGVRVLCRTAAAPGLPYITASASASAAGGERLTRLRDGLMAALTDPRLAGPREDLLLTGARILAPAAYRRILDLERAGGAVALAP